MMELKDAIIQKKDDNEKKLKDLVKELENDIHNLKTIAKDLNKKLQFYDNAHTPPSRKMPEKKKTENKNKDKNKKTTGERGAPKGHKGATSKPKPTKFKQHTPAKCPECGSKDLKIIKTQIRDITEVPPQVQPETTRHHVDLCSCKSCGKKDIIPETDFPTKGNYGNNIVTQAVANYIDRLPHRRNAEALTLRGIKISPASAHNIITMVGACLTAPTKQLLKAIRAAVLLHIDETSIHLNGKNVWAWVFYIPGTNTALYVVRPSRGRDVLEEILGDDWKGTIICDGHKPYMVYDIQRCWAHIMREMHHETQKCGCKKCLGALEALKKIYEDAKDTITARISYKRRKKIRRNLYRRVKRIIDTYTPLHNLKRFMGKLGRALPNLFRFVLDPTIPPTNNAAERALREIVVHRKIRGGIRSEKSMETLGNLFSCVMTWRNAGLNYLEEMVKYL